MMHNCPKPLPERAIRNGMFMGCLMLSMLALPALAGPSGAQYEVLYNFPNSTGSAPDTPLIADAAGNLYGATRLYGAGGAGTVFKFAPDGTETVLYSFTGGNDGSGPEGPLVMDKAGNLYGVAFQGGTFGQGVVFKIAPDGSETVLHDFGSSANDGDEPVGGLAMDKKGNLYGVAQGGGPSRDGVVFVVKRSGKLVVLHSFAGADGKSPGGGVTLDKAGNIYGTTLFGGPGNVGTVYKVAPDGTESVIYAFQNGLDGGLPDSHPMLDKSGNLIGTTLDGGSTSNGVVYKVTPAGAESVLYSFSGGADGSEPYGTPIQDRDGNLYGTTAAGGNVNSDGVVYKLAPDGTETVLHAFTGGLDGDTPYDGLITDPALGGGYLYGTTSGAACLGCGSLGTIFKIKK